LEALVPADPASRIVRPLGPTFNNRVPVQLADGSIFNASITDLLNPNAKGFYRGPGFWNTDVAIVKNFNITERFTARFSADFFNVFNHPNDLNPDQTTGLQDLSQQRNDPRIIQFSLRLQW